VLADLNIIGPEKPVGWVLGFWPVFLGSFLAALAATALCKKIALKYGIVDKPDDTVKTHKEPIAYLGGIGMLIGLLVGILTGIATLNNDQFAHIFRWLIGILAGGAIACFIGLTDDVFDIKPWKKILGQVVAALILIWVGIVPNIADIAEFLHVPLPAKLEPIIQAGIVIFFVLGATNSLNLLDGLDGLCGGVTVIITLAMLVLTTHLATWGFSEVGDPIRIIICLGLVGGVCGFLPFNRHPAKIFILLNKRPLFVSDRGHIYDQMIDRGIPLKKTVVICYLLAMLFAIFGVAMGVTTKIRTVHAFFIYAALFIISGLIIWRKGYLKMEGLRGKVPKKD
jgi:UDP-GlcNAc:undecaprenyl-phosphate GlcNAc-1-phosphate transferase